MPYRFVSDDHGRSKILVTDEPAYVVRLAIAPAGLEEVLQTGQWLVVVMSVWSTFDVLAGRQAIELARRAGGKIKIGLRPFNYPEESAAWLPATALSPAAERVEISVARHEDVAAVTIRGRTDASPIWAAISDGRFLEVRYGRQTDAEVGELLELLLPYTRSG